MEFGLAITLVGVASVFLSLTIVGVTCWVLKKLFKEEKAELASALKSEETPKVGVLPKWRDFRIELEEEVHRVRVEGAGIIGEKLEDVTPTFKIERDIKVVVGNREFKAMVEDVGGIQSIAEEEVQVKEVVAAEGNVIRAPMQGTILRIPVRVGNSVEKGEVVVVLEAMKMENEIGSPVSGVVKAVKVSEGDTVAAGDVLVVVG